MHTRPLLVVAAIALAGVAAPSHLQAQDDLTHELEHIERSLWHGWATHDAAIFREVLTDDALNVGSWGVVSGKADMIEVIASHNCELKDAQFADWKAYKLTDDSAILSYTVMQKGDCDGHALPAKVAVSSVYVRHNDPWMSAMYHETELAEGL